MPFRPRTRSTGLAAALAAAAVLTGCTGQVDGIATPAGGLRMDATDADLRVDLAEEGNETDRIARNALADVLDYWVQTYPGVYGEEFGEVEGGFWSIDPDETDEADLPDSPCFDSLEELEGNAFYCYGDDRIFYDRAWMEGLAADYGPFVIAEIMAHEMGHAVQGHADLDDPSIVAETQAECFAGAWTKWVVDGNSDHFTVRAPELDPYLLGYLYFGDPAGSDPDDPSAHGSLFDQLSAFQEGYADGPQACAAFDESRLYTLEPFEPRSEDEETGGNLPYDQTIEDVDHDLAAFWEQAFTTGFPSTPPLSGMPTFPDIEEGEGSGSVCTGEGDELDIAYCPDDGTVRFDGEDLLEPAYDAVGDYAVFELVAVPYALAIRDQLGLSTEGAEAFSSAICASGWMARELYLGEVDAVAEAGIELSPGDVDEAAVVLLQYATEDDVIDDSAGFSGFELVDAFRQGFVQGGRACGL
ncbi:neutral zinc metallopeptidase [Blastococcus sp. SYSU D00820]